MDLWSSPTPVTELNTVDYIEDAPFSQDGLTLYFSTNRPGSFGRTDLWVATRTSLDEPFGTPEPLDEINSIDYEEDPWVSEDGSTLYFASARNGPMRIYMATRSLP
jgi:Tol biopolymer transport system component